MKLSKFLINKITTSFDKNFYQISINNRFEAEKFEPELIFEKTINEIRDNHLKIIASAATNLSAITSFDGNFDPLCINNIFEAEHFQPEQIFENTVNDIKDNHLKSITSINMNVSDITSNKPSLSSKHLESDHMTWKLLHSPGKSPQFTHHLSSM